MRGKRASLVAGLTLVLGLAALAPAAAQSGEELFEQAGAALGANDAETAADLYGQAIRSGRLDKPMLSRAFLERGRAYQLTGSHARAVADFTNALWLESLVPADQARAHGYRSVSRKALGQDSLASEDLSKAKSIDPQFAAAPVAAAQPVQAAAGNTGEAQSEGLLDRLLAGGSGEARQEPEPAPVVVAQPQPQAPAAQVQPALAQPAQVRPQPEPVDSPSTLDSLSEFGSGLIADWFGSDEGEPQQPVAARQLERPTLAPVAARSDAPLTVPSRPVPSGVASVEPQPKPEGADDGSGPVRLVNLETGTPAREEPAASRSGIMGSLFGSSSESAAAAPVPSATPETITYSESRVASAPPWTLGGENASSSEERAQLPNIPARPTRPAAAQRVATAGTDGGGGGGGAAVFAQGQGQGRQVRQLRAQRNWMAPAPAGRAANAEPVQVATPQPVQPAQVVVPERPAAAGSEPAPIRLASAERIEPATEPRRPTPAEMRVEDSASVDWEQATAVDRADRVQVRTTIPPRQAPSGSVVRAIPAPQRTIPAPRRTAPAPVAAEPVEPAPVNVAALDWDTATEVKAAPAPTPVAAPAPQLRGLEPAPARRAVSEPTGPKVVMRQEPEPQRAPPAAAQPSSGGVLARMWDVATEAFSASSEPATAAPPPRSVAVASRSASGGGRTGSYAVQVSAQRTQAEAEALAATFTRRHSDLFGGAKPFVVKADIPGKGTYYRVRVGPFAGNQSASTVCQQLKGRGADCFAVRL